jgi:hypothetical protein
MKSSGCYTIDLGMLGEHDVDVWFDVSPYVAATMYDCHGDPGSPAEGGEVELEKVNCPDYPMLNAAIHTYLSDDQDFSEWAFEQVEADYETEHEREAA